MPISWTLLLQIVNLKTKQVSCVKRWLKKAETTLEKEQEIGKIQAESVKMLDKVLILAQKHYERRNVIIEDQQYPWLIIEDKNLYHLSLKSLVKIAKQIWLDANGFHAAFWPLLTLFER